MATEESGAGSSAQANADPRFVSYYAAQSLTDASHERFFNVKSKILALRQQMGLPIDALNVADVGCGPGGQGATWAREGHAVSGIDISEPLIALARQRAQEQGLKMTLEVGSADRLPYEDRSFDVVLLPELLEHVPNWEACLNEAVRVLRPGGVLYLATNNRLCPVQQEYTLPLYSWYPGFIKRRCERLAVTTRREWVQFSSFPAVNWFTFFQLRGRLRTAGLACFDRFDLLDPGGSTAKRLVKWAITKLAPLRWIAHVCTPYTIVYGAKAAANPSR